MKLFKNLLCFFCLVSLVVSFFSLVLLYLTNSQLLTAGIVLISSYTILKIIYISNLKN